MNELPSVMVIWVTIALVAGWLIGRYLSHWSAHYPDAPAPDSFVEEPDDGAIEDALSGY